MSTQPDLWDRLPGEPVLAFNAFKFYRDTPAKDRSIRKCILAYHQKESSTTIALWGRWSTRFNWVARVEAFEDDQDRIALMARADAIKAMQKRHVQTALSIQSKAIQRLQAVKPEELTHYELIRFFEVGIRLERLALGEPESIERIEQDWKKPLEDAGINPAEFYETLVQTVKKQFIENANDATDDVPPEEPAA